MPGRIELLGKHTDYAGGRSLLCATDQGFSVTARERPDPVLRLRDEGSDATAELPIRADLAIPRGEWVAYPATVARRLARDFGPLETGLDFVFKSDLPRDAGLSSSSALVVSVALALIDANRLAERPAWRDALPDRESLAGYLGAVENGHGFGPFAPDGGVGTMGGSQDQTAILCARAGMVVQYGWIPVRFERAVSFPRGHLLAIGVSGVLAPKTREAMARYNHLAGQTAELLRIWQLKARREAPTLFAALGSREEERRRLSSWLEGHPEQDPLRARLEQFWNECEEIIPQAALLMNSGGSSGLGEAVDRSQQGAEAGLGNQVPETVHLQRRARALGAAAASAFGAGFGGAVWALITVDDAGIFLERWKADYLAAFPEREGEARFLLTRAGPPAGEV